MVKNTADKILLTFFVLVGFVILYIFAVIPLYERLAENAYVTVIEENTDISGATGLRCSFLDTGLEQFRKNSPIFPRLVATETISSILVSSFSTRPQVLEQVTITKNEIVGGIIHNVGRTVVRHGKPLSVHVKWDERYSFRELPRPNC